MGETAYQSIPKTEVSYSHFQEQFLNEISNKFGTPLFLIEEKVLRSKVHELKKSFINFMGSVRIAFSMKANFNPTVLKIFISENILFDITSIGELFFYLNCHGNPENVIYTSVTETRDEFDEVLDNGIKNVVIGSYNGLINLMGSAFNKKISINVMIRVNPEVGVKAGVRASYRYGKFGVPFNTTLPDSATSLLRKIMGFDYFKFEGFHFHLGSQIEDPICFVNALEKLETFISKMRREFPNLTVKIIDIGGGTPVCYGDPVPKPGQIGSLVTRKLNSIYEKLGGNLTLIVESGRFLSAESCTLVSKVVNTKVYSGHKFVFVDTGYHLLLDAALLHQEYPQEAVPYSGKQENVRINLAGRLCDTYDIFPISTSSRLSGLEIGNFVLFRNVGAYSIVFNMPFHSQTKPPIVLLTQKGEVKLIRKGETIEELFGEEGGNLDFSIKKKEQHYFPLVKRKKSEILRIE
jgi:diaminopimelate decarboxylase